MTDVSPVAWTFADDGENDAEDDGWRTHRLPRSFVFAVVRNFFFFFGGGGLTCW